MTNVGRKYGVRVLSATDIECRHVAASVADFVRTSLVVLLGRLGADGSASGSCPLISAAVRLLARSPRSPVPDIELFRPILLPCVSCSNALFFCMCDRLCA